MHSLENIVINLNYLNTLMINLQFNNVIKLNWFYKNELVQNSKIFKISIK